MQAKFGPQRKCNQTTPVTKDCQLALPPPPPLNKFLLISAQPCSNKCAYSCTKEPAEYGYVSTKVHLPLIAHKCMVKPNYKNSGRCLSYSTITVCPCEYIIP